MFSNVSDQFSLLIFSLLAVSLFIALAAGSSHERLPKKRLIRALRLNTGDTRSANDLPSIARERYTFLKNRKRDKQIPVFIRMAISIEDLLIAAGLKWRLSSFCIVIFLVFLVIFVLLMRMTHMDTALSLFVSAPASIFFNIKFLTYRKDRQLRRFRQVFPEALDLIVRSVRAGLPVSEAVKVIGAEVSDPVGEAFREVASNLAIGMGLEEALAFLQKKVPLPEVKFFVISLTIQQETGGNLAEILSNLASIMRKRVQIGKKISALSSEAKASAYIIGSLPFLVGFVIFVLNREYIEVLFVDSTGRLFLYGALGSIFAGVFVMAKLVRFEI